MRLRVDRVDLRPVDHQHGEAVDRVAVRVPRVHVAVHGGGDHLEVAAVAVEVGEHGRADEAVLRPVARAAAHVLERLERLSGVVGFGLALEAQRAVRVPHIDLALMSAAATSGRPSRSRSRRGGREDRAVRGVRVHLAAVERALAGVQRQRVGVHGPAGQLGAVAPVRVHVAVRGRRRPPRCGCRRRGRPAAARTSRRWSGASGSPAAARASRCRYRLRRSWPESVLLARRGRRHDPHHEAVRLGVRAAVEVGRPGRGLGSVERAGGGGEARFEVVRSRVASTPLNALVCGGAVAPGGARRLEVPAGMSVVLPLLGSDPGATSTRHV